MFFKEVIGQKNLKQQLVRTLKEGRVSHAQLFIGPEGSGNLAIAIAFAQYLSCENRSEEDSCGECPSCLKYEKLIHPDLHFVYPVATTKSITKNPVSADFINEWRNTVIENPYLRLNQWYETIGVENKQGLIGKHESHEIIRILNLKTFESEYKIMIVWMPEKMNHVAANKLLKIIEEPPAGTIFLLVSEVTENILPTIMSRAQIIKIPKIEDDSLAEALKSKFDIRPGELNNIIKLANGNYQIAQDLIGESEENRTNFEFFTSLMRLCYAKKISELIGWVNQISGEGREKQKQFLKYSLRLVRENLMMNVIPEEKQEIFYLTPDEAAFSQKFYPYINENNVVQISEELDKAHSDIAANANNKIVFLDLGLKLIRLIKM